MPEPGDLAERLADMAAGTIRNHRRALISGAGHLRGLTLGFELRRDGEVVDSHLYLEHTGGHRATGRARLT